MDKTDKIDLIMYAILGAILFVGGLVCKLIMKKSKIYIWLMISMAAGCILLFMCVCCLVGVAGQKKKE